MFSQAVILSNSAFSETLPLFHLVAVLLFFEDIKKFNFGSCPSRRSRIYLNRTDFPDAAGPIIAVASPIGMDKFILSSIVLLPKETRIN